MKNNTKLVFALSFLGCLGFMGCEDDSSAGGGGGGSNTPQTCHCPSGQTCDAKGNCITPQQTDPCDNKCTSDQTCVNGHCEPKTPEPDNNCNNACTSEQRCIKNKCVGLSEICEPECKGDSKCVENKCVFDCDVHCGDECCEADQVCDSINDVCASLCSDEQPQCAGMCCDQNQECLPPYGCIKKCEASQHRCITNDGVFKYCCDEGMLCDPNNRLCVPSCDFETCGEVCCGEDETCFDNACVPKCSDTQTRCGADNKLCCDNATQICLENACVAKCSDTQTRCGAASELCCDSATEVCVFNKCVKPTSTNTCETENDCDFWSTCDVASHRCVSTDADESACTYNPPTGEFSPKLKWHYPDSVVATPVVINLTNDNDDDVVDQNDIPDVIFVNTSKYLKAVDGKTGTLIAASSNKIYNQHNDIAAADIDNDGEIEVVVPSSQQSSNHLYGMVLKASSVDGKTTYAWVEKYKSPALPNLQDGWADVHPTIANVDANADDIPDIITTRGVLKGNDWSSFQCTLNLSRWATWYHNFFAVADLDQDGKMEIIDNDIYDATTTGGGACAVLMNHADGTQSMTMSGDAKKIDSLYTAVADLIEDENDPAHPGELKPEIIRVRKGNVSVWKVYKHEGRWIQRLVWDKPQTSSAGGGNPVVADFDGNGQRDIGVAGKTHYSVFNGQSGNMVWAGKTIDASSESTGSSVFDFEGDGIAEVVYRDETRLRIYSGQGAGYNENGTVVDEDKDGYMDAKVLWWWPNTSGTVIEYPLIVDVDNDGRTEVVMVSEPQTKYGTVGNASYLGPEWTNLPTGIDVYSDSSDNWVRTRRIWNQHAYHVTNINEDGTVPRREEANWLNPHLNNYRMNVQPSVNLAPDFIAASFAYSLDKCNANDPANSYIELTGTVKNDGSLSVSAPVALSFYAEGYTHTDGNTYRVYLGTEYALPPIAAGATRSATLKWKQKGFITVGDDKIEVTVDPEKVKITFAVDDAHGDADYVAFNECHEENNGSAENDIKACPNKPVN